MHRTKRWRPNSKTHDKKRLQLGHAIHRVRNPGNSKWVAAGGLRSYGASIRTVSLGRGLNVDRILKGEKPADLPVQAPTKYQYQLVIKLKSAKALGLEVPPMLLARADEIIE